MQPCLLIEISKESIAFSFYTDGNDNFQPYTSDEVMVMPLAVWINHGQLVLGTEALREANKGNADAYIDLFAKATEAGQFEYQGEKNNFDKLLLLAIKSGLNTFFNEVQLAALGSLEQNKATLPLVLIFSQDLSKREKVMVRTLLRADGFMNVTSFSEDRFINIKQDVYVTVTAHGDDVNCVLYRTGEKGEPFVIANGARDPRIDALAKCIWDRSQAKNDWLEFDMERPLLVRAAQQYLQMLDPEYDGDIILSNGRSYHYYLTEEDKRRSQQNIGSNKMREIAGKTDQYGATGYCTIYVKRRAADNDYLLHSLRQLFSKILVEDEKLHLNCLANVLKYCRKKNFDFTDVSVSPANQPAAPNQGQTSQAAQPSGWSQPQQAAQPSGWSQPQQPQRPSAQPAPEMKRPTAYAAPGATKAEPQEEEEIDFTPRTVRISNIKRPPRADDMIEALEAATWPASVMVKKQKDKEREKAEGKKTGSQSASAEDSAFSAKSKDTEAQAPTSAFSAFASMNFGALSADLKRRKKAKEARAELAEDIQPDEAFEAPDVVADITPFGNGEAFPAPADTLFVETPAETAPEAFPAPAEETFAAPAVEENAAPQSEKRQTGNWGTVTSPSGFTFNLAKEDEPTPRQKRDFRFLQKGVEASLRIGNKQEALQDIEDFASKMARLGVVYFDSQLAELRSRCK